MAIGSFAVVTAGWFERRTSGGGGGPTEAPLVWGAPATSSGQD